MHDHAIYNIIIIYVQCVHTRNVEFESVNLVIQVDSSFTGTAVVSWVSSCRVCDTVI